MTFAEEIALLVEIVKPCVCKQYLHLKMEILGTAVYPSSKINDLQVFYQPKNRTGLARRHCLSVRFHIWRFADGAARSRPVIFRFRNNKK